MGGLLLFYTDKIFQNRGVRRGQNYLIVFAKYKNTATYDSLTPTGWIFLKEKDSINILDLKGVTDSLQF